MVLDFLVGRHDMFTIVGGSSTPLWKFSGRLECCWSVKMEEKTCSYLVDCVYERDVGDPTTAFWEEM